MAGMAIFSEKIIGKVKGLLQEHWDSKIDHLLREANRIGEQELILEKDADIIAAGLKKIIESASAEKVKELLPLNLKGEIKERLVFTEEIIKK